MRAPTYRHALLHATYGKIHYRTHCLRPVHAIQRHAYCAHLIVLDPRIRLAHARQLVQQTKHFLLVERHLPTNMATKLCMKGEEIVYGDYWDLCFEYKISIYVIPHKIHFN